MIALRVPMIALRVAHRHAQVYATIFLTEAALIILRAANGAHSINRKLGAQSTLGAQLATSGYTQHTSFTPQSCSTRTQLPAASARQRVPLPSGTRWALGLCCGPVWCSSAVVGLILGRGPTPVWSAQTRTQRVSCCFTK